MYGQLVRAPGEELLRAARPYVCVRVTDMRDVDLQVFTFDYDLTFAALLMHPDGTVYHRFGSRDETDASHWSELSGLAELLRSTLAEHQAHVAAPAAPAAPLRVIDLPPLRRKLAASKESSCVHCHTVHDTLHAHASETGTLHADAHFVHPPPARIGLVLDPRLHVRVLAVHADSPAAHAGLRAGDVLVRLGAQRVVRTLGDVQWALHVAPPAAGEIDVVWRRGEEEHGGKLSLPSGWKRSPPEEYAWRPYKWNLAPDPGFGGALLGAERKRQIGLPSEGFALRIDYLITWGEKAHRGRAARAAGLREGDIVVAFAGQADFASHDHFQAWVRLTRAVGEKVEVVVWRERRRLPLELTLPD